MSDIDLASDVEIINTTFRESPIITHHAHDNDIDCFCDVHLKRRKPAKFTAILQIDTFQRSHRFMRSNEVRTFVFDGSVDPTLSYVDALG